MARMAEENPYRAILFGHTHVPYAREVARGASGESTLFVNVGSAGRPKDGDWRVCYALVDPARLAAGEPAVEFVRVPYDYERLTEALAVTDLITSFEAPPSWPAPVSSPATGGDRTWLHTTASRAGSRSSTAT